MTDQNWEVLNDAFERATALTGEVRDAFLTSFAQRHPELVGQLNDLLVADGIGDTVLSGAIAAAVDIATSETPEPWVGKTLGPWTVRQRLAVGGMGTVFLADRADSEYTQKVALKVMGTQLHSPSAIVRFKAERQILADLNHPNISRLLDGGSTDDGVPYLVMEYVDGEPIDRYCEAHGLSINERLKLMRKVCDAVGCAHRQLIIHRDLKPSNILVDNDGEPKLLDFGIAKLLDPRDDTVAETQFGTRAMTPEYASPEQVRGEAVSTATDVYALGVLLFRLLTGESPYGRATTSARDYEHAIIEQGPRKPSTVVTAADASGISSAPPEKLRRLLTGDLDNIVLKTLQKEPARRYPTVDALSEDLRRYLRHEPVTARGEDAWYLFGKFVKRRARALSVGATVVATIIALVVYYTLQLADERDRANAAATQSQEVSAFLTRMFESASPHTAKGEVVTAVDLLQRGSERIEELDAEPEVQAELMRVMAGSMTALGYRDRAIPMLLRVLEMQRAQVPPDPIAISYTTNNLAEAYRQLRQNEEAEKYMRQTLEIARREFGPTHHNVAYLTARLGVVVFGAYRTEEALALKQEALDMFEAIGGSESSAAIDTRGNLANALSRIGRMEESEAMHRETIALSLKVDGELAPNTLIRQINLTLVLTDLGKLDAALAGVKVVDEKMPKVWPEGHEQYAWTGRARANPLLLKGRFDEALQIYRESADIMRTNNGADSNLYVRFNRLLGMALRMTGRYAEARALLQEGLDIAIDLHGADGGTTAMTRLQLAVTDSRMGDLAAAEPELRRVLSDAERLGHDSRMLVLSELSSVRSQQGDFDEATRLIEQAIAEDDAVPGSSPRVLLSIHAVAASHYRRSGELQKSLAAGRRIADTIEANPELLTWEGALALAEYGVSLQAAKDASAGTVLATAFQVLDDILGEDDPRVVSLREQIG